MTFEGRFLFYSRIKCYSMSLFSLFGYSFMTKSQSLNLLEFLQSFDVFDVMNVFFETRKLTMFNKIHRFK